LRPTRPATCATPRGAFAFASCSDNYAIAGPLVSYATRRTDTIRSLDSVFRALGSFALETTRAPERRPSMARRQAPSALAAADRADPQWAAAAVTIDLR
jgi:hypothetical protein